MKKDSHQPDFQEKLEFLFSDHNFAAEERWKYSDRTWEVFKFYMTLLTGAGGFVLTLTTISSNSSTVVWIICVSAAMVFIVGLTVFMQLIRLDIQLKSAKRRLQIARNQITKMIALESYINELRKTKSDLGTSSAKLGYSIKHQLRRAVIGMGLKTQLVLINSAIGTLAITLAILAVYGQATSTLIVATISYLSIVLIHAIIAYTSTITDLSYDER